MRQALTATLAVAAALAAQTVLAHPGHGMGAGSHWHPGDTVGLLVVGVIASAACWFTRNR
jgi:hypothetical protein